ncbi:MAG: phenylalanyl-tRNA synthetase alpha chain [Thermoproteota archaeon]|nr:phenylalanyl-tRNA synthetase alpha chain [Thermoproteota archaeon]
MNHANSQVETSVANLSQSQEYKRLHRLERMLLLAAKDGKRASMDELKDKTRLLPASVSRAALWLSSKDLAKIDEEQRTTISLGSEGEKFQQKGFPERILSEAVLKAGGKIPLEKASEVSGLSKEEVNIALGWARRKNWLQFLKDKGRTFLSVEKEPVIDDDEKLISFLSKSSAIVNELDAKLTEGLRILAERPDVIVRSVNVRRFLTLTLSGLNLARQVSGIVEELSQLTPELITSRKWKSVSLRKYDIKAPVSSVWPGKKQPYKRFLDELKLKLVALGFKEMEGPIVEFMFFNCDALYMPQDHPAREIHDIYYVKKPSRGDLSDYSALIRKVRETHENGWETGSRGWGYKFSSEESKRLILRSQGTPLSVRMLINEELEIPGKYFSIKRCYRPDVVDRTHLTEFNQVEGIVVSPNLTFRDLLGVLEKFALEVAGAERVRFKPDYFPFTEPSVELAAYKKDVGWLEFGGAGMFRPEVTLPLGIKAPVIAWGLGVDRLFMMNAGINDIRNLFTQDLEWLRKQKVT